MPLARLTWSRSAHRASRALIPLAGLAAACVAGAAAVYTMVLSPANDRAASQRAAYERVRQAQQQLHAMRETQEAVTRVWERIPPRTQFSTIIIDVSELARKNEVKVPGMSYAFESVEDGLAVKASMTFQAQGAYAAIRRFIHRLEATGPHLFIESLDVSQTSGSRGKTRQVLFNLRVVTYLRPEQGPTKHT